MKQAQIDALSDDEFMALWIQIHEPVNYHRRDMYLLRRTGLTEEELALMREGKIAQAAKSVHLRSNCSYRAIRQYIEEE